MFQLTHNFPLKGSNTFGVSAIARHYLTVESTRDLIQFLEENHPENSDKRLFLGSGSNLLFTGNYNGLIIHPDIQWFNTISEDHTSIEIEVGAGVIWDDFVKYTVENGWYGIENLSLIPGTVGAAPVQNIGAYGVEAESFITKVTGIDLASCEMKSFDHEACEFGYRTSVFKARLKEQFMVSSVVFRLSKQPQFHLDYTALKNELSGYEYITLYDVRKTIIAIRESKLPDPMKVGNAGSFFKNPVVSEEVARNLKILYPDIPLYPFVPGQMKIAAGWLIEKAGWKGKSVGRSGVSEKQALVIINKGGASGEEIFELSESVAKDVYQKFNIALEREVQVVKG